MEWKVEASVPGQCRGNAGTVQGREWTGEMESEAWRARARARAGRRASGDSSQGALVHIRGIVNPRLPRHFLES